MVAYFKKQTWLFMLGGLAAGLAVAALLSATRMSGQPLFMRLATAAMLGMVGVVAGRMLAIRWTGRRLADVSAKLYRDCDPEAFLRAFEPIAADVPADNVAFADARTKIAFAREALGDFDGALAALEPVRPEGMKLHRLHAEALLLNQRTRVLLMQEDVPGAEASLKRMEALQATAQARARMLGQQLNACCRLARNWLAFLKGGEVDAEYLRQESELARNDIYRAEMELLLGRVCAGRGEADEARRHFEAAVRNGHGLCACRQAAARLASLQ